MVMWSAVRWTEAGQVAQLFELSAKAAPLLVAEEPPEQFFATLKDAKLYEEALMFVALALPRRLAIAWGRNCVGRMAQYTRLAPRDTAAFSAVGAWLQDASDERRFNAFEAARQAEFRSAEAMLAFAVYASGGNMSPSETDPPAHPSPDMAGRLVHGAISLALMRVPFEQSDEVKLGFLDAGSGYASGTVTT